VKPWFGRVLAVMGTSAAKRRRQLVHDAVACLLA
jgi:hypothetical protein